MKKMHYAWVICAIGMLMMFCNMGLASNILSVYLPFIQQNGISGAQGSAIISVRCFSSFIGTFLVSKYYKIFSLRTGLSLATLLSASGIALFAAAGSDIWIYYLGAVVMGVGYAFGSVVGVSLLIKNWFVSSRGTALGLCSMGTGIATIIFAPFITANTLKNGLTSSCIVQAVFMVLCAVLTFAFVRSDPKERGASPYIKGNNTDSDVNGKGSIAEGKEDFSIPTAVWIQMLLMMFLMGGAGQTCSSHITITESTAGYAKQICGISTTIYGVFLIIGKVSYGPLADKIGALRATLVSMVFFYLACLSTLMLDGTAMLPIYLFPVVLGLGCPFFTVGTTLWAEELSPKDSFEKTLRWFQIMYSAGGIVVTAIPGRIADITGEYKSSYMMLALMLAVSMIMLINFYSRRKKCYNK